MNRSLLDNASLILLSQQSTNNLLWMTIAPMAFMTNLVSMLTIAFSRSLHVKSQFVIFSFLLGDALQLIAYFALGLKRYTAFLHDVPQTSSQLSCQIEQYPLTLASRLSKLFAFALAMDRLCCMAFPILHRNLNGKKYILFINSSIWFYCVASVLIGFLKRDDAAYFAVCTFDTCFDRVFVAFATIQANVVTALTAIVYALASLVLYVRYKKVKTGTPNQMSEWRTRMDLNAFVVVSIIGTIYLSISGLISILNAVGRMAPIEFRLTIAAIISTFTFTNSMSHMFVFLIFNPVFRKEFIRLARKVVRCGNSNAVGPVV